MKNRILLIIILLLFSCKGKGILTKFENDIWVYENDPSAGIKILDNEWIMIFIDSEYDEDDIYKIKQTNQLLKFADTKEKPGEFLILSNSTDTLYFELLGYDKTILSLLDLERGKIHILKPKN